MSGVIGVVVVACFNFGLAPGLAGLAAGTVLCWRWLARVFARLGGE
jgi:hypothetical protein